MNKKLPRLDKKLGGSFLQRVFWIISNNSKFLNETHNLCVFKCIFYVLLCSSYELMLMMILKQPKCLIITQILMKCLKCPIKSILK